MVRFPVTGLWVVDGSGPWSGHMRDDITGGKAPLQPNYRSELGQRVEIRIASSSFSHATRWKKPRSLTSSSRRTAPYGAERRLSRWRRTPPETRRFRKFPSPIAVSVERLWRHLNTLVHPLRTKCYGRAVGPPHVAQSVEDGVSMRTDRLFGQFIAITSSNSQFHMDVAA